MSPRFVLPLVLLFSTGAAQAFDARGGARPDADIEQAQIYNRPPAELDDAPGVPGGGPDSAALTTRLDRLERDVRQLTGQNEELQHKVQVLEEQLRAARQEPATRPGASNAPAPSPATPPAANGGGKRSDAFDPAVNPDAPGAPRPLGTTAPSPLVANPPHAAAPAMNAPPVREAGQPIDIGHGRLVGEQPETAPAEIAAPPAAAMPGPKEEYDLAVTSLRAGQYESAEKTLAAFLAKNPNSKFAPAAIFNLGESFFLRGRHREAAEKYLEISTKYGQSGQAPEAMLRLGQSLSAMGAREQACASFAEIGVKYPSAAGRVKEAAQRESKKIQC